MKIYEALKLSERERMAPAFCQKAVVATDRTALEREGLRQKLLTVHRMIESALPNLPCRVIGLVGASGGEGTSTLARELAKIATTNFGRRVGLIDMSSGTASHHQHFGVPPGTCLGDMLKRDMPVLDALPTVPDYAGLYLGKLGDGLGSPSTETVEITLSKALNSLREHFDLILLDLLPFHESSDALVVARESDGIIITVEAEKTRWPVVHNLKEKLIMQGANVLGVILNKRRFHIPSAIYRRL